MERILIGNKQYIGKKNVDNYIDIDISRTIETIKRDSVDNVFDFQKQYDLERNDSLKFCLYGLVESRFGHCDNLSISITIGDSNMSGSTQDNFFVPNISAGISTNKSITLSSSLNNHANSSVLSLSKNIYGAAKGSYFFLFELDKKALINSGKNKTVYVEIYEPIKELFGKFSVPIIYFDNDKDQVDFGTENADINDDNEIVEINNNFPFFYDRHWVKLNLEPSGPETIFFIEESQKVFENISEVDIEVSLSSPSKYGLERAKIVIDFGVDEFGNILTTANFGLDFVFVEPILTWLPGEQIKTFKVKIIDNIVMSNAIKSIVFKIIPLSNVRLNPAEQTTFTLLIESEDVPARASFGSASYTFAEPNTISFNSTGNTTSYTVDIQFSQPVVYPNQSIGVILIGQDSTINIGGEFYIDPVLRTAVQLTIPIPINATSVQFPVYIVGNGYYDIDKYAKFELIPKTSGVTVGNTIRDTLITITDGMEYRYTDFVLPIDLQKGNAVYKTIYNANDGYSPSTTILKTSAQDPLLPFTTKQLNVTNLFNCDIRVKNLGSRIPWNNQLINVNDEFVIPVNFSSLTSDYVLRLPTNLNRNYLNAFKDSKYEISFENFVQFYTVDSNVTNHPQIDSANYYNKVVDTKIFSGSTTGSKVYMVTELLNAYSSYDIDNDTCSNDAVNLNLLPIKYNGTIFVPHLFGFNNANLPYTSTKLFFNDMKVIESCAMVNNDVLPVGIEFLPSVHYSERFIRLDLGEVFVQAGFSFNDINQKLRIAATISNGGTNAHRYFRAWSATNIGTKSNIILSIKNKGNRDVTVNGKIITSNQTMDYNYNEYDFSSLSIILPTNEDYVASTNSFKKTNYEISINNVKIYNNNAYSNKTVNKTLPVVMLSGDTIQSLPSYKIEAFYNHVLVPANMFYNFDCNENHLTSIKTLTKNVLTNDLLLFANTGTQELSISYVKTSINPSCQNTYLSYEID